VGEGEEGENANAGEGEDDDVGSKRPRSSHVLCRICAAMCLPLPDVVRSRSAQNALVFEGADVLCVLCCRAWERRAVPIKLIGGEELTVYRWVTDTPRQLSRKAEFTRSLTWSMTWRHLH
jgi:hypothetical protein